MNIIKHKLHLLQEGQNIDDFEVVTESVMKSLYESNINETSTGFIDHLRSMVQWLIDKVKQLIFWIKEKFRRKVKENEVIIEEIIEVNRKEVPKEEEIKKDPNAFRISVYSNFIHADISDVIEHIKNLASTVEKLTYTLTTGVDVEYPDWLPSETFVHTTKVIAALAKKFLNEEDNIADYQKVISQHFLGKKVTIEITKGDYLIENIKDSMAILVKVNNQINDELNTMRQLMEVFANKLKLLDSLKGILKSDGDEDPELLKKNYINAIKLYTATITLLEKYLKCVAMGEDNINQVLKTIKSNQEKK
jgi:hypothetical protein